MPRLLTPAILACGLALATRPASAQSVPEPVPAPHYRHAAGLVAGVSQFDLSGTGTTALVGARLETELQSWLVAEGALGFFRPQEQFPGRSTYTIPEVQLQVQYPGRVVRPYLGLGGGYVFASAGRETQIAGPGNIEPGTQVTGSGAVGLRVAIPDQPLLMLTELRVRGIGQSFSGSTAEWTIGLVRRF